MAFTTPRTWVAAETVTAANLNTHVRDNEQWLVHHTTNPAPIFVVTLATPVGLTTSSFTSIPGDTTIVSRGGALSAGIFVAPSDGLYEFAATVSITDTQGNKEARLAINGDETVYIAGDNAYGAGSSAPSRRSLAGMWLLDATDTVEVMVFTDAPTPGSVDYMVFCAKWIGVA